MSFITRIKRQKFSFINSGPVDIIRTVYYVHGPKLMKLNFFADLYVWWTMGLTRCYKTEVFFTIIYSHVWTTQ